MLETWTSCKRVRGTVCSGNGLFGVDVHGFYPFFRSGCNYIFVVTAALCCCKAVETSSSSVGGPCSGSESVTLSLVAAGACDFKMAAVDDFRNRFLFEWCCDAAWLELDALLLPTLNTFVNKQRDVFLKNTKHSCGHCAFELELRSQKPCETVFRGNLIVEGRDGAEFFMHRLNLQICCRLESSTEKRIFWLAWTRKLCRCRFQQENGIPIWSERHHLVAGIGDSERK